MKTYQDMSDYDKKQIREFALYYGKKKWKAATRNFWMTGVISGDVEADTSSLQMFRNYLGPSVLADTTFDEVIRG